MRTSENSPVLAKLAAASIAGRPGSFRTLSTPKTIVPFNASSTTLPTSPRCHSAMIADTSISRPTETKKIARNRSLNGRMSDKIRWL